MKNFFIVTKWRSKENFSYLKRQGARTIVISMLAVVLLAMVSFPLVFYMRVYLIPNFSRIAALSDQLRELTGIDLKLLIVAFFSSIIFSILFGSDLPIVVSNLFFSKRAGLLFQMPIKKPTIAKIQLFEVLTAGGLPVLLFVPVFLGALRGLGFSGGQFWLALILLFGFIIDTLALTAIVSFGLVFLVKGRFLKMLSSMMTIITLFAFIFTLRFMDFSSIDLARPDQVAAQFGGLQEVVTSPFLPWSLFVRAVMGDFRDVVFFLIYSVLIFVVLEILEIFLYSKVIQKLLTRPAESVKNFKVSLLKKTGVFMGILRKDFLLLVREPKLTFAFLYPSLFVPVVITVNPMLLRGFGIIQLLGLIVFLFSNYTTVSSTALFAFERQIDDSSSLYPLKRLKFLLSKVFIVGVLYSAIIFAVGFYISYKASIYREFMLSFVLLMIPTIFTLSLLGGYLEKRFGTKDSSNVFKALNFVGALFSFILSTLLPVFTTLPLSMYASGRIVSFLDFMNLPPASPWTWFFGLVLPISIWVGVAWASLRSLCYNFD